MQGKAAAATILAGCLALAPVPASAGLELLMLDRKYCEWCELWDVEIGGIYGKTEEGRCASLRRMSVFDPVPDDVTLDRPARYTPTFILLEDGREVGRIDGYPGADFFWPMLQNLIARAETACETHGG